MAPSWSWASVNGAIGVNPVTDKRQVTLAKVIDAGVVPAGEDETEQGTDGFVRLQGYLATMTLVINSKDDRALPGHSSLINGKNWKAILLIITIPAMTILRTSEPGYTACQ